VLGGTAGAIKGAIQGDLRILPNEKAGEIKEEVENLSAMIDISRVMAEYILEAGHGLTDNKYRIIERKSSVSITEMQDYPVLLEGLHDIILTVAVISLEFKGEKGKDPDMSFEMRVDIDVKDTTSGRGLYPDIFEYVSEERKFSDWMENNAQLLKDDFKQCYQTLAERIVKKIFSELT